MHEATMESRRDPRWLERWWMSRRNQSGNNEPDEGVLEESLFDFKIPLEPIPTDNIQREEEKEDVPTSVLNAPQQGQPGLVKLLSSIANRNHAHGLLSKETRVWLPKAESQNRKVYMEVLRNNGSVDSYVLDLKLPLPGPTNKEKEEQGNSREKQESPPAKPQEKVPQNEQPPPIEEERRRPKRGKRNYFDLADLVAEEAQRRKKRPRKR